MSSSLAIEAADKSARWYLLPGAPNAFELRISNVSDRGILCKLNLDEPADAGMVTPSSATLKAGESRLVSVTFKPEWLTLRDRKVIVSARDAAGTVLAMFVHDIVAATTTDCSVSLGWKDEIAGEGALRGFVLSCTLRSISSTPGIFEPVFSSHASLRFPEALRIALGPGESSAFDVPVIWNRSARDNEGWNHPRTIEVGVAVTHGRRSASAPWDLIQQHIEPYLTDADRAPVVARRPPPPQFAQPGGVPPPVSPLAAAAPPQPNLGSVVNDSHAARIARAEMEAGVAVGGMRLPPPPPPPEPPPPNRDTISIAPGTLLLIALAFGAILVVFMWQLKPAATTTAVSTTPVPLASPAPPVAGVAAHPRAPKPHATGSNRTAVAGVTAAAAAATPNVTAGAPTTVAAHSAAAAASQRATNPRQSARTRRATPQRVSAVDRGALPQIDSVAAEYLRGGRMVHVYWNSYAQASANVQLLDDKSTIVSQTTVSRREAALLWLPRGYRGSLYVQVTAIGYHGERVLGSTSLPPP